MLAAEYEDTLADIDECLRDGEAGRTVPIDEALSVDNLASQELGFPLLSHFDSRRNNPSCIAEVLRINFFALARDISRTRAGALLGTATAGFAC